MKPAAPDYLVSGDQFEGCECNSVCQCIFSKDATFDQCRGIVAWTVKQGHFGATNLAGMSFAASLTKSGKNLEKSMGHWEGVLFVPQTATPAQKKAIEGLLHAEMGAAFAKMEVRTAPIHVSGAPGTQELTIGAIGHLKLSPLHGADGQPTRIIGAPSPIALPVEYCATSAVDTYRDGPITTSRGGTRSTARSR
jgi:hypothetical protein